MKISSQCTTGYWAKRQSMSLERMPELLDHVKTDMSGSGVKMLKS